MTKLEFKVFIEEDIKNWLLGRRERDRESYMVPPVSDTPDTLMASLEAAEASGDVSAANKVKAKIAASGYAIKINRTIVPASPRRRAAK